MGTEHPATKNAGLSCTTLCELQGPPVSANYGTRGNILLPIRTAKDEPSYLDRLEFMPSMPSRELSPSDSSLVPQRFLPGSHHFTILRPSCCQPLDQDTDVESRFPLGPATSNLRGSPYLHNTPEVETENSEYSLHPASKVGTKRHGGTPDTAPSRMTVREASEHNSTGSCTTTGGVAGLFIGTPARWTSSTSHDPACYVTGILPSISERPRDDCSDQDATESPRAIWDQNKLTGGAWGRNQAYETNTTSYFSVRNANEKHELDSVCPSPWGIVRRRLPVLRSPLDSTNIKLKLRSIEPIIASGHPPDYERHRYPYYYQPLGSEDPRNDGGEGSGSGGRKRKRSDDEGDWRGRDDKGRDEGDEGEGREEGEPPRKRRKKTEMACTFCRGRKLKCDGRRPTCGNCDTRKLACKYDEAIRRRGPGKKKKKPQEGAQVQQPQASAPTSLSSSLFRDPLTPYLEVPVLPPPPPPLTPEYPFPLGTIPSSARLETLPRPTEAGPSGAYVRQAQRDTHQPPRLQPSPPEQPYSYERTYRTYEELQESRQLLERSLEQGQGPGSLPHTATRATGSLSLNSEPSSYRRDSSEGGEERSQSDDGDDGYTSETPLLGRRTSSPPETEGTTSRHLKRKR